METKTVKLNTSELLKVLTLIKPSLMQRDYVPVLSNYLFEDTTVSGYNDIIGITLSYKTGITGGIKGDTLFAWLNSCPKNKELTVLLDENTATFKCGRSKFSTPLMGSDKFIHKVPVFEKDTFKELPVTKEFVTGLNVCVESLGEDAALPQMTGVTVSIVGNAVTLYSTNGMTITRYMIDDKSESTDVEQILPREFCKALTKLYGNDTFATYQGSVTDSMVSVSLTGKDITGLLYSKLINTSEKLNYENEIEAQIADIDEDNFIKVSNDIKEALTRITSVYGPSDTSLKFCNLSIKKNTLYINAEGSTNIDDEIVLEKEFTPVSINVDVHALTDALKLCDEFLLLENIIVLVNSGKVLILQASKTV